MKRRIIIEYLVIHNKKRIYSYNISQQYDIVDGMDDTESCATLRLHCKPRNTNQ